MRPAPGVSDRPAPRARRRAPTAAAGRAFELARHEGLRSLLFAALGATFYRRLVVFQRELGTAPAPSEPAVRAECGWLGEDRLAEYEALRPGQSARAAARLAGGERCFGTWVDGELAAVRWIATGAIHVAYLDLRLTLEPGEVFHHDSFTAPGYRRRGLSAASQERLAAILRDEGHRRILRAVLPENRPGIRDAERAGYRPRGRVGYVRLGPWRRELGRGPTPLRRGARWVWVRALSRTVYRRLLLTERRLDGAVPVLEASVPLEFSFLEPTEADAYSALRSEPTSEEVTRRLERGDRCWTARREGRIVSARWVVTDTSSVEIPYLAHRLELAPAQAYVYESFTALDHRGAGVSGAAGSRLARLLADEGCRTMLAVIWPDEKAIVRANVKAGYEPVGTIHSLGIGRWRHTFLRR